MSKTETAARPAAEQPRDYDEVTYLPGEGDPVRVQWNGLTFAAHIPTKVSKKHTILALMPSTTKMPDGTVQTRHTEQRIAMVELARTNPSFSVNGERSEQPAMPKIRVPESPDDYRGYAMKWIAGATEVGSMEVRWSAEHELRERCGVSDSDIAYIRPFFEAKYEILGGKTAMVTG